MPIDFATDTNFKRKPHNIRRVQIHVVEAQGISVKGSKKSPNAYVTVESPGIGILHQTGIVGKGKEMIWHENTKIVDLQSTAGIKFTVKRQTLWPTTHDVLGSTDTYDLGKLIEMQGRNDKETSVALTLKSPKANGNMSKSSLVINIRDLDTQEQMQQVRENATYAASIRSVSSKDKQQVTDSPTTSDVGSFPNSVSSLDLPRTPMTASSSFSTTSAPLPSTSFAPLPTMSASAPHLAPVPPPTTAGVLAATSVMSTAVASPITPSTASSLPVTPSTASFPPVVSTTHRRRSSTCSSEPSLSAITEELRYTSLV
ncbi:hypothetical protein AX15_004159 [Amanita polypyramis BW_CC]|nr:hypothetical protein AX15_004159 [Amanita polypyramis BW_CC]